MATTVAIAGIRAGFSWDTQKETLVGVNTTNSGGFSYAKSYSNGLSTNLNTVNKFYVHQFELAPEAVQTIDLAGVLTDPFGDSITFGKVRYIYIELVLDDTKDSSKIEIGGGSNLFGTFFSLSGTNPVAKLVVQRGGNFQLVSGNGDGYAVTAGTGDILTITNSALVGSQTNGTAIVRICIAGVSPVT